MKLEIEKYIEKISKNPGVYLFKNKSGEVLYVGKATNLKSRVASYFNQKRKDNRPVMSALKKIKKIETKETETVLEALILEAILIKKHQPKYNVDLKDDKSFSYAIITEEDFPRVLIVRETELSKYDLKDMNIFGPYTSKKQLEIALKIIRKIFPFHSRKGKTEKGCLEFQIGLCPGPYENAISQKDYKKNIQGLRMIFRGKKKDLIRRLEKEMKSLSQDQNFEKAAEMRNKIFALNHIREVALLGDRESDFLELKNTRIEAYDISNILGQNAVGSMVVFEGNKSKKSEYRKFKIKTVDDINDVGMMAEVLFRRFSNDWDYPDLILLDGGKGHLNMAKKVLKELNLKIPLVAVAKGQTRKKVEYYFLEKNILKKFYFPLNDKKIVKQIMDEAHRFAIQYHRKLRRTKYLKG